MRPLRLTLRLLSCALALVLNPNLPSQETGRTALQMPNVGQRVAIKSVSAELVEAGDSEYVFVAGNEKDDDFVPVPLAQLYNHHWVAEELDAPDTNDAELMQQLVQEGETSFTNGPCRSLSFTFGGGSEMRNTPIDLPDNKRYFTRADSQWGLNLHLIDLRGVAKNETQKCHECNVRVSSVCCRCPVRPTDMPQ